MMKSRSDTTPAMVVQMLPDGCVRITVGGVIGTVSSYHLVEPKLAQIRRLHSRVADDRA
jgi:hypothetical protein